ncbi:60S ribosomal protein L31 [Cryptosporidium felis]|nr:60S ribosomal protein L31 [Cryptosporidium felis]
MSQVGSKNPMNPCTRDYTINLSKMVHKVSFKKRAPRAIKGIREFAGKVMKTEDVRIDAKLNKFIFSKGIRNLPTRVRVRISRRRSESENSKDSLYTLVQYIPVASFAGLQTEKVQD